MSSDVNWTVSTLKYVQNSCVHKGCITTGLAVSLNDNTYSCSPSCGVHWPLTCSNSGVWNKTFLNRTEECHVCYVLWFVACIRGLKWDYIEKKGAFIVLMLAKMVCLRAWRCTVELFSDISLPFYLFSFSSSLSNPCSFFFQMHASLRVQMWVHDHNYQNTEDTKHICWTNGRYVETRMLFLIVKLWVPLQNTRGIMHLLYGTSGTLGVLDKMWPKTETLFDILYFI